MTPRPPIDVAAAFDWAPRVSIVLRDGYLYAARIEYAGLSLHGELSDSEAGALQQLQFYIARSGARFAREYFGRLN